ncbi:MarR family transcriptional regulator [Magnetospirillum sp. 15-1]|uniref:MarR family winged helix-turn-helix transcriptional regulator n=1 Tax=Magnetospirillum sp. 15-1 TaxID=1979370 RepID=UPI000BBC3A15|nr:MarR family transcriptional regulator [Magnetospirillum sp. 15-1]
MPEPLHLEALLTFRLSSIADTLERAANQVYGRRWDLSLTAWRTLAILAQHEPTTAQNISRRSHIDKGWISRSVARLEERGLLLRVPNDKDNRSQLLSLTDAGRDLVARIAPLSRQRNEALLSVLSPEEAESFLRCLELVQRRADAMLDDDDPG